MRIFVDHFIYNSTSYTCYFETATNQPVYDVSGPNPQTSVPSGSGGRGTTEGQPINSFCSDTPNTTKVHTFSKNTAPFFTFTLETNASDCPVSSGGGSGCDIMINALNVTNETTVAGNNGQVQVAASSSHGPILYSIDGGATYVTGNTFTNLAPGNYTLYVKDANDCETLQGFAILAYNNPVQNFADELPVVTLPDGNVSRWNAAFNPIVINYQRKDFIITSITQYGANQIKVQMSRALLLSEYTAGLNDGVYFKSPKYEFYGKPDSYDPADGYTVTTPFLGADTTGFLNIPTLKPNFYVQSELTTGNNPVKKSIIYAEHTPGINGLTKADLAPYLQSLLSPDETYDYLQSNYKDYNLGGSYTLRYREIWDTGSTPFFTAPYPLYYTYAAIQLGEQYGGNMANYVPYLTGQKAKFLTGFRKPVIYSGLPFDLGFIYSENVIDKQLYLELLPNCGAGINAYLLNADATYLRNADASRFIIQRIYNTDVQGYPIIEALGVNRLLIPDAFDCCTTELTAQVYYGASIPQPSNFHFTVQEQTDPYFIDGNITLRINGIDVLTQNISGTSDYLNAPAGSSYEVLFFVQGNPSNLTSIIIGEVNKGVSLLLKTVNAYDGQSFSYSGIVGDGVSYNLNCYTSSGTTADNGPDIYNPDAGPVIQPDEKVYISEKLKLKYECTCDDLYVYLKWINNRGAWDYWRFGFNQGLSSTTSGSEQISKFVNNWQDDQTIEDYIARNSNKKIALLAGNLTLDELQGLSQITKSRRVQMMVSKTPVKWQTVLIADGDFPMGETKKQTGNVKLTIQLPADNNARG